MTIEKGQLFYEGKAKRLYDVKNHPGLVWQEFKDSLTAFNAQKKGDFLDKGPINRDMTSLIFRYLKKQGINSHWVEDIGKREMITTRLKMLKVEVVLRNRLAGSTAKKFALEEGTALEKPLLEFFYKDDALNDPFISDEQALMLKIMPAQADLERLKKHGYQVNEKLKVFFAAMGIDLIDFKIEFGLDARGEIVLADEITPDSCRLWDQKTGEKLDKDRFRRDLGRVKESYEEVYQRMRDAWEKQV
jgi:phosphoribosylaminoimidazole-succinocarboxamide synthase